MPQPAEVQQIADELIAEYQTVADIITRAQAELAANPARRRALVARLRTDVNRALDGSDSQMRAWIVDRFPNIYLLGATSSAETLGTVVDPFALVHQAALKRMMSGLSRDLLQATRFVRRDTKRFVRESAQIVAEGKLREGETAVQAGKRLARLLDDRGIRGITYKDGSRHSIDEYSQMAIRTTTATAYNEGTVNAAREIGVELFECFDGPFCGWSFHDDTESANGKIVTGDEALGNSLSHANCRRSFGARPDLVSVDGAQSSVPDAQNADARAFELERATNRQPRQPRQPRTARATA